jgi:nitrogen fixation protein NifU and related proteins
MDRAAQLGFVLDHATNPRNQGALDGADAVAERGSPECGDRLTLYLKVDEAGRLAAAFTGEVGTIGRAAASLLTELVAGRTLDEAAAIGHEALIAALGPEVVAARPRSATLAVDTLHAAIAEYRRRPAPAPF